MGESRKDLLEELAAMAVNDLYVTTAVRTTPEFHAAMRHQEAKLGDRVFKAFAYGKKVYVVRVK